MLLRNLNPSVGLWNGTRLIVRCFTMRVIEVEIIRGKGAANVKVQLRDSVHGRIGLMRNVVYKEALL
ncbi:unnamed protein product [Sphagnum troendelagicum]|uniref:DNA helicase Pif1-like 2B domain-containing protein n=1 Tax=Sphagnum troendelagicum TaxID=128251 RepID=A0ABP0UX06_9BRYO